MPTFGSQPTFTSWRMTGWNTENNVVAALVTSPAAGTITSLSCYFAGSSSLSAQLGIWNSGGTLVASTGAFTAPTGTQATNGQTWNTVSLSTPYVLSGAVSLYLGWWRNPANGNNCIWSYGSGSSNTWTTANSTGIGNTGTFTGYSQGVGAYATYSVVAAQQFYINGTQAQLYINGTAADIYINGNKI